MTALIWILMIFLFLALNLLLFFLFYILLPSIDNEKLRNKNAVFSDVELNYVIPKKDETKITGRRAIVLCNPDKEFKNPLVDFNPMHSCKIVSSVFASGSDCKFACVGLGDCVKVCPQEAIYIRNHTAVVSNLCIGCGMCVKVCPKGLIKLVNKDKKNRILCNNSDQTLTSCNMLRKDEKIERKDKKDFKIWESCYNIIKH